MDTTSKPSTPTAPAYRDASLPIADRVEDLLGRMTVDEKIGQMTQAEKNMTDPEAVSRLAIGSVLSGGGGNPDDNSPAGWLAMVRDYLEAARRSRLGIPLIYGVDAVHGHNNVRGATIFPHNVGLGAAADEDLLRRIGRATAAETCATGVRWNFAPCIAVPQDQRWGRTYEGYGEDPALVSRLGAAYIRGLQGDDLAAPDSVLATGKHYAGDGGTTWGTSTMHFPALPQIGVPEPKRFMIDQGDTRLDEATLRAIHLAPYSAAVRAGAQTVMASFSSWNGDKLHAHHYLLTEVLKGEMGFAGFVVTDWAGIDQVDPDKYKATVACINAGVDMSMAPFGHLAFIENMKRAVESGDIPMERVDDAVRRILTVKMRAGLFEDPGVDEGGLALVGCLDHRALAREAAARSAVLLKNDGQLLPLAKDQRRILVAGQWADDIGYQCGGWTIEWMGGSGRTTPGTSILEAIRATVSPATAVEFDSQGMFAGDGPAADVGLAFVGEKPYAEGFGDQADLALDEAAVAVLERLRGRCRKLVVVLVTGRPLIISEQLPMMDALVVAWLPGTEGQGVADVLFGDAPFSGKLPYTWPLDMGQYPLGSMGESAPLFPRGFGLD
jgi:beta-glucosidase